MKSRQNLVRLKQFQVTEKRRQILQLDMMIAEFDRMAGDMLPLDEPDPAKSPEVKARRAAAAAKTARRSRKGERRARGQGSGGRDRRR